MVEILELSDLSTDAKIELEAAIEDVLDLLNDEDLLAIGESLEPGSSAVAIVIEHAWARISPRLSLVPMGTWCSANVFLAKSCKQRSPHSIPSPSLTTQTPLT